MLPLERNDIFNEIDFDVEEQTNLAITIEATTEEMVNVEDDDDFGLFNEKSDNDFDETTIDPTTQIPNDYSTEGSDQPYLTTLSSRKSRKRNRNRNRTTSAPLVSDTELLIIGKELFDIETSNLIQYVSINYQNETKRNETKDCSSQKYSFDLKIYLVSEDYFLLDY